MDLSGVPTRAIGDLLHTLEQEPSWHETDYAPLLDHQLSAPLLISLKQGDDPWSSPDPALQPLLDRFHTMREVLESEAPPLELLEMIKAFAKGQLNTAAEALPQPVATGLYYAAIASALSKQGRRITTLSDAELGKGFAWLLQQPWLVEPIDRLAEAGLQQVGGDRM